MIFLFSKLLWMLVRPSTAWLICAWVGVVLVGAGRRRSGLALLVCDLMLLTLVLVLPIGEWLLLPLETRFPRMIEAPFRIAGIVVLGGAVDIEATAVHGIPTLDSEAERMTTFVSLARRYPQARLAFTGGSGLIGPERLTEADVARMLFDQLGLNRPVLYEDRSRNTYENASLLYDVVMPKPDDVWILVTSASHMPRAVGDFRRVGWDVLPWPVAYKTGHSFSSQLETGFPDKLASIDWAVHEWVGLVAYKLLGRTSALFPAPLPRNRS